jgi:hypothetical protein
MNWGDKVGFFLLVSITLPFVVIVWALAWHVVKLAASW